MSFRILEDLTAGDSLGISGKNVPLKNSHDASVPQTNSRKNRSKLFHINTMMRHTLTHAAPAPLPA
jgi:hypothetical protein